MAMDKNQLSLTKDIPLTRKDIEQICQNRSELAFPPQAFLICADSTQNSLLAVSIDFLDGGEGLPWPGIPLLGATLNLDWGYAFVHVINEPNGLVRFEQPSCRFEDSAVGDVWGYRFYPVDNREIPKLLNEFASIRSELSERRTCASRPLTPRLVVTDL
jgi:hypothetical protein